MKHKLLFFATVIIFTLAFSSSALADDAAALYQAKCKPCHGADGAAGTPAGKKLGARDFHSAGVQKQTDAQLLAVVKNGLKKMPKFDGKLTEDQMKQLVAYVRDLGKK